MSGDQIASLVYLVLLVSVLGGSFLLSNRQSMGTSARHAMLWGLIFVGLIAGFGLWTDVKDQLMGRTQAVYTENGRIEIPKSRDGHFYLTAELNGVSTLFVIDTGATNIVLSQEDAERAGIDAARLVYSGRASTANGIVRSAPATIQEFSVDGITDYDIEVWVNEGELRESLLGMDYISLFDSVEISGDRLTLQR